MKLLKNFFFINTFPVCPGNTHLWRLQLQCLLRDNVDYTPNLTPKFVMKELAFVIIFTLL